MTVERVRVREVLTPDRAAITPDPLVEYRAIGLRSFGKGIFHYEPQPGDKLGSLRFFDVRPGRLVISNIKGWEGAIAVSSELDDGCVASNRFLQYVPRDDRIDVRWASWFFLSERGIELIQRASPGSADRNRTLAIDRFEALEIPLPPIDRQRRDAVRLDRVRDSSTVLTERFSRASTVASALTVSATVRPDLDEATKEGAGWQRVPLEEILTLNCDEATVDDVVAYPIAGVYSFGRGMFLRGTIDGSQTSYKLLHRLRADQLVMSRLKAWEGALALTPFELDGCFVSPEFPTFDINATRALPKYLELLLTSPGFWGRLKGASKGIGARRERVNAGQLLEQCVDLPSIATQQRAVRTLEFLQSVAAVRTSSEERLKALVAATMNEAFAELN